MMKRQHLPNRRSSETVEFNREGSHYRMTVGYFPDGQVGEVFINADRANSTLDAFISDAAILVSLSLQHGATLDEITHAIKRDAQGIAASPIGGALDRIANTNGGER
jgi:hypothetical protein